MIKTLRRLKTPVKKVLLLCGPSGSGKTYIEKLLKEVQMYEVTQADGESKVKVTFNKLNQVTTRKPRSQEEVDNRVYDFVNDNQYEKLESSLFARTNVNGNRYGTYLSDIKLSVDQDLIINTVVINYLGIQDLIKYSKEHPEENIEYIILYIDSNSLEGRNDRDNEFLEQERKSLENIYDLKLLNNAEHRLDTDTIINALVDVDFI